MQNRVALCSNGNHTRWVEEHAILTDVKIVL